MDLPDPQFQQFDITKCPMIPVRKWLNATKAYDFAPLRAIEKELNESKHTLDFTEGKKIYKDLARELYYAEALRGNYGILVNEFGAQIVTKAWMKIYELLVKFVPIGRDLYSFHVAEAPGAFLPSLNHLLRTKYPDTNWEWFAESYVSTTDGYLGDHYGLIKKYRSRWILGADGDGDVTSSANIRWFRHHIREHFPKLDLFTSDVKFAPPEMGYDFEEVYQIPVHVGHTICALKTLTKGGIAILKTFTYFESQSVSLLYLLCQCFEQVVMTKPITSSPANSETYIVCLGFLDNVTPAQTACLYKYLVRCRADPLKTVPLFAKSDIPAGFVEQVVDAQKALAARQMAYIKRQVDNFKKYKDSGQLRKDTRELQEKIARDWINEYEVEQLKDDQLM